MFGLFSSRPVQGETQIRHTVTVQADGKLGGNLKIRSLTGDDALCEKVVEFLKNNKFEFYRNGDGYTHEDAVKTVNLLRSRTESGNPFSGFPVLDGEKVVGFIRIGFDDDPRKLQIAAMELPSYQNRGLGKLGLNWILSDYLPQLHAKGFRIPVFANDGKTVKEWVALDKSSVVATVHPDFGHCNRLLTKSGFKLVNQITIDRFSGAHDGRRNIYEIGLKEFIRK